MLHDADPSVPVHAPCIQVRGAREHNLKNLSVDIPRGRFVVVTGVSGSGKSTLAFDLLFAEGQRRFLDSLNTYARQFVEHLARPDVDLIAGLPPTVSIEQTTSRGGGKSTVATVTEIYQFVRLLFARVGVQHCPDCKVAVVTQTRDELADTVRREARQRGALHLLAPVVRNRKGFHNEVASWAVRHGYFELRIDGKLQSAADPLRLDRFKEHDVEVVIGTVRKMGTTADGTPLHAVVDRVLEAGDGVLYALDDQGKTTVHSIERACPTCRRSFGPADPKNFSYNSSQGWCPRCRGFGELFHLPDIERGANGDSVEESWWRWSEGQREVCPDCQGARLHPEARAVRLSAGLPIRPRRDADPGPLTGTPAITDFADATVAQAFVWADSVRPTGRAAEIARDILPEIRERLRFLAEVGLGYLQLGRGITSLSGGEAQRIRLAAQLGSNLSGVLYILDEPTIGLHSRDNDQLLAALLRLRDRGNSLVVVEHDEETMRQADHIIDLGPGAGVKGGEVVAAGTLEELRNHPASLTGQCLRERPHYPTRKTRRPVDPDARTGGLTLAHARLHNLQDLTVRFPLGRFIAVTGVSGSGKSTLVKECLFPAVTAALAGKKTTRGGPKLTGVEGLCAVHEVDQSPIGRTPRSTPATYVGFFDDIRQLFSTAPEAKLRGYGPGRFSFNSSQGRCPECEGTGTIALEMNFLPTAHVRCELCGGRRFNPETLDVRWNGLSIADVLDLSVAEAITFFAAHSRLRRPLEALHDTGLDYLRLGQTSPTLSGGEAQRIKLVSHLLTGLRPSPARPGPGPTRVARQDLFILEEPTIGLHIQDVRRLVEVLQRLVDAGHTVIVIEHNLDLIAEADWVIDLGPEAGADGGRLVAEGTPEMVAKVRASHTGRYLREFVGR